MKFLVDEDLPRSIDHLLRSYGHEAVDVRDIGLPRAKDSQINSYAQNKDLCLEPLAKSAFGVTLSPSWEGRRVWGGGSTRYGVMPYPRFFTPFRMTFARGSLVTGDFDFSNIRNYPPAQYAGIIVLSIPKDATSLFILNLFQGFLKQDKLVSELPGKLAIVEPWRIRIRKG